jgi:hypothetical protein
MSALSLATEATGNLPFGEQLRGYLIVVFSVGLFCGSIYWVLATNVGARTGMLLSLAALFAFLSMLGMIWFTNLTPLNALHGPAPAWHVKEVLSPEELEASELGQRVEKEGKNVDEVAQGEIKASVDTALTTEGEEFFKFQKSSDYIVVDAKTVGGENKAAFRHKAKYTVMQIQGVVSVTPLPGQAPPPPAADPDKPVVAVLLERDLGALRQPPLFMAIGSGILCGICLVLLHRSERAKQLAERTGSLEPAPAMA